MVKIDIHTHRLKSEPSIQILNTFAQDLPLPDNETLYSAGLHPYHLGLVNREVCLHFMELAINNKTAGVCFDGNYHTLVLGFPFETISMGKQRDDLIGQILKYWGMKD